MAPLVCCRIIRDRFGSLWRPYTKLQKESLVSPFSWSDGHNSPWLVDELVPCEAAMIENIGVGFEDPVGYPVVAHELPDVFHRVEFGGFRWQRHGGNVGRDFKRLREVPSGLIDDNDGVGSGCDGGRDFPQMKGHGGGVAFGQDQGRSDAPGRADGAEDIGRAGALVAGCRGARSALRPAPRNLVLLADPGFVLEPDLYGCSWRKATPDFRHAGGEVFLNAAIASGSCAWWHGRAESLR